MQELAEVRLKCLELAHRHDYQPGTVVQNAKVYEQYVMGDLKSPTTLTLKKPTTLKQAG